ncbi:MAG: hypothetical protein ACJ76H_13610 [Bacteriovoracaceae bacterium]
MFYLKEFFKSLGESWLRGTSFILFSCLLAFSLTHRTWVAKTLERITPEKMVSPYFVAVMDESVNAEAVRTVMQKIPGVMAVSFVDESDRREKIDSLVKELGPDYAIDSSLMNFQSLRFVMNPSLSRESLDFIRGQVVKAGGTSHMTATAVRYPEVTNVMNAHPFYRFLGKAGDWGVIGLLAILWVVSFWLCYDVFRSRSYLIEKFQRRKLVAAKSIATGLMLIVVMFTAMGLWHDTLKFFDLVILFMIFSVFWTFSMQEWRWKPTL